MKFARATWLAGLAAVLLAPAGFAASPVELRFESPAGEPLQMGLVAEARDQSFWTEVAMAELTRSSRPWFGLWLGDPKPDVAPLAGTYSRHGVQIRFQPSLPLLPGQTYTARLDAAGVSLRAEHRTAAPTPAAAPKLLAIYPSGDRLPANHLKFYLVFSEPMEPGVFLNHCRLTDARGNTLDAPFRETELWSPDGRRLTLWFHPGRQKTGVNLNVEFGPVLTEGKDYRLIIDGRWPSRRGAPLGIDVTKSFHVLPPLHEQLAVKSWQVHPPAASTREALRIEFPYPLDWATLHRMIRVTTHAGPTPGEIAVEKDERVWRFVPAQPWTSATYQLHVNTAIEDQAGNSLARPFEVNLLEPARPTVAAEVALPFTPR